MQSTEHAPISTDAPRSGLGTSPTRPIGPRPALPEPHPAPKPLGHDRYTGWNLVRTGRSA